MSFSIEVAEKALVACGRHCCLCHKFCSTKIELHHIKQKADGGEDSFENCIPLCLDCHAEVKAYNPRHPKGRQYTESELKQHRDTWYEKINQSGGMTSNEAHLALDKEVFCQIRQILTSARMQKITSYNYAGFSYNRETMMNPLYEFLYRCDEPEFEFIDVDLEAIRITLKNYIDEFTDLLATNGFVVKGELSSIPAEWEYEQPERFWKVVNRVHEAASEMWKAYSDLIKLGRRKLGI
jgi:hypothetical protein